jgi:3-hydroxyisobutyrate dehydrogenase-like beta-hydroxyacid dehydrogenase
MSTPVTIGIYSPGAMGSALGRSWQQGGARVVSTVAGRSERTRTLAAGLELLPGLADVVDVADVVVSIGPPADAVTMAAAIADTCLSRRRNPVVADLNAIAPSTVRRIAAVLDEAGSELLDGSISGGPPSPRTSTRLYLSGPSAGLLADLASPGLHPHVIAAVPGQASAVKMCTAAMYKGFTGLLLQSLRTADAHGVTDVVLADLREEFGRLTDSAPLRIALAAAKADRYPGEMREIAEAQSAAGGQRSLFEAMAEVFESLAHTDLGALSPEAALQMTDLDVVLAELR